MCTLYRFSFIFYNKHTPSILIHTAHTTHRYIKNHMVDTNFWTLELLINALCYPRMKNMRNQGKTNSNIQQNVRIQFKTQTCTSTSNRIHTSSDTYVLIPTTWKHTFRTHGTQYRIEETSIESKFLQSSSFSKLNYCKWWQILRSSVSWVSVFGKVMFQL